MAQQTETIKAIPDNFVDNVAKYRFYIEQYKRHKNEFTKDMLKRLSAIIDAQLDEIAIANGIGLNDVEGKNALFIGAINHVTVINIH